MQADAEPDGHSLAIDTISPTGDETRRLGIWVEGSSGPSVGGGPWHTHGNVLSVGDSLSDQIAAVVDLVGAILRDEFVLVVDVGGAHSGHTSVLDLREPDAIAEELTDRYSPGSILIKSWSGARDRAEDLDTISAG